ncbi:MAG: hypothetical protein LBQ50_00400 [Planctomycetaceae bacterium]|jgi:hypothetical protein|nr:hypothetical protein [Planctomycetaceae bacterium]
MNFLNRYWMARIDRALDEARPLDGWTAWYVRRNPVLWEYYAAMLQLELELRFPDTEFPNDPVVLTNCRNLQPDSRLNNRFKKRTWIGVTAAVFLIFITIFLFSDFLKQRMKVPEIVTELAEDQKIDLAEVFTGLFFAAVPVAEVVSPIENPFDPPFKVPALEFPVEPIVHFTDRPLESTLTFLETAGIVRSIARTSNHERD